MDDTKVNPPDLNGVDIDKDGISSQDESKNGGGMASSGAGNDGDAAKASKLKRARRDEPLKKRLFWWVVYALIAIMMAVGVYMIIIQYVYIGDSKPFEPPPSYSPVADTPAPATPEISAPVAAPGEITPSPTPTPAPTSVIPLAPVQITLVKPRIQCDIEPVGATDGVMDDIDSATTIAWYKDAMTPDEDGNCILNGHVTWEGKRGAFGYLNKIEEGEEVILKLEDGSYRYYEVNSVEEHPIDNFPKHLLASSGRQRLTLVTCKGDYDRAAGTSLTRTVVICLPKAAGSGAQGDQ